jgi:hypothetical protein
MPIKILTKSDRVINHIFNELTETKKDYSGAFTLYEDFIECKLIDVTKKKRIYIKCLKEAIKKQTI